MNREALRRSLGREPGEAELALAHQQGAGGAAGLLQGRVVSPRNLALNNAGGLSAPAAAQKIMAYYGYKPGADRNTIAAKLASSDQPSPAPLPPATPEEPPSAGGLTPPSPTVGPQSSLALQPPEMQQPRVQVASLDPAAGIGNAGANPMGSPQVSRDDIAAAMAGGPPQASPAPPVAATGPVQQQPTIEQAPPPVQVAQAKPPTMTDTGPPNLSNEEPKPPALPQPTPRMRQLEASLSVIRDPVHREALMRLYDQEKASVMADYNQQTELFKHRRNLYDQRAIAAEKWRRERERKERESIAGLPVPLPPAPQQAPGEYDKRLGTDQSPQRSGIPGVSPPPPGTVPKTWAEEQTKNIVKAEEAYRQATPKFQSAIDTIRQIREHPGREWGTGALSNWATATPGTPAYGFAQLVKQLQGGVFLQAYGDLKGGGSITEVEGGKAEQARARLATAQNKQDFDKALNDYEQAVRGDLETVQRRMNKPVTAYKLDKDDVNAPDIGERRGNYEYTGGNWRDRDNWRRVK
jgi:hypothetical protein